MFVNLLVSGVLTAISTTVTALTAAAATITALTATTLSVGTCNLTGVVAASGVTALLYDGSGKILLATGATVPADATTLYAKGCLFIDTDVATGTTGLYCNKGTAASAAFTAVTQA